jgi:hypothetical protein
VPIFEKLNADYAGALQLKMREKVVEQLKAQEYRVADQQLWGDVFEWREENGSLSRTEELNYKEFFDPKSWTPPYGDGNGATTFNLTTKITVAYKNCESTCLIVSVRIKNFEVEKSWFGNKGASSSAGGK